MWGLRLLGEGGEELRCASDGADDQLHLGGRGQGHWEGGDGEGVVS